MVLDCGKGGVFVYQWFGGFGRVFCLLGGAGVCWFGFFKQENNLPDICWKSNIDHHKQAGRFLMDAGDIFSTQMLDVLKKRNYQ